MTSLTVAPRVEIDGAALDGPPAGSLFDCAERLGVRVPTSCHKQGKCRECMVEVIEGLELLTSRAPEEVHLGPGFRLACRTRILETDRAGGTVRCRTLRRGRMRIETESSGLPARLGLLDPAVQRQGGDVCLDGHPLGAGGGAVLGLAVDVGTTTVVLRLVDLETGEVCATTAFENPQRFGGSDVMARIHYDAQHPGKLLQRTLLGYLGHAIEDLPCDPQRIFEVVIAGNSTMRDLLFGLDVSSIGQRPYRSLVEHEQRAGQRATTSLELPARRLRLPVHPGARVVGLPLVSGHVGADAAACILAADLMDAERWTAVMDIGTNTELLVGKRDQLFVASCPAGPAFEGGLVTHGMPALDGAVESVQLGDDGTVRYEVIGGGLPQGLCGSGLVDLLGELLRTGRMDTLGRLTDGADCFLVDRERGIGLSEMDISHLAQAKGANVSGVRIVLQRAGLDLDDLSSFQLAGGFARHLRLDAARRIGLVPDLPDDRLVQIGNASIEGATAALLSVARRRALDAYVQRAVHVELETDPGFFDCFVEGCQLKPVRGRSAGEVSP